MKIRKIISLIIDTLLIGMISFAFLWVLLVLRMNFKTLLAWFTFPISISLLIVSFIDLVCNIRFLLTGKLTITKTLFILKLNVSSSALVLFLTVLCYLQQNLELYNNQNFLLINLILHYICPVLFSLSFIFLETDSKHKFKYVSFSPILVIVYFAYVIPLVVTDVFTDPYGFINFTSKSWFNNVLICLLYFVLSILIAIVLYSLNHIFYMVYGEGQDNKESLLRLNLSKTQVIVDEDKSKEEDDIIKDDEIEKPVDNKEDSSYIIEEKIDENLPIEENKDEEVIVEENNKTSSNRGKIYHVTYREDIGMWSVKFEKGKRAIKLFKTQAEAIKYTKQLMKTQDASIRVHSLKGKIRKI
ncbi:MAG: DUF2188 domain-containing protein [Bacilli bacterium]